MASPATPNENSPFSFPVYRTLWIANLASNIGTLIQSVGASWTMIASGASPQWVALVTAFASLPMVFLSLPCGAIADNLDRRKIMIWAQVFLFSASALLAGLSWAGLISPWSLLLFTFLVGCGTALNGPAWQASVGDTVPRAALPGAVAFNAVGVNIARSAGPAIGGIIVATIGGSGAFLVNALSSLGLIYALLKWRPDYPARLLPPEQLHDAMGAGLRFVWMSPQIGRLVLRAILFAFSASATQALMPLIARDNLGGGPFTFGLLLGSFGVGAVAGGFANRPIRANLTPESTVRLSSLLTILGLGGAALSHTLALTMPVLLLAGVGWVLAFSTINVSVQLASPRWVVARSLSLYQTGIYAGLSCGSWIIGAIANKSDVAHALLIAAGFATVTMILALAVPLAQFNRDNLDPLGDWEAPETDIPVGHRSGPIVITIEHRVAEENAQDFVAAMHERRRIRLRDGARHWTLLRDLGDRELWIERYHVPTWLDYLRYNNRRTHADTANAETLQRLRIGGGEPVVHRRIERQVSGLPPLRGTAGEGFADETP